jgi:hypothetical protein
MIEGNRVEDDDDGIGKVLCLNVDKTGPNLFKLKRIRDRFFIADVRKAEDNCAP